MHTFKQLAAILFVLIVALIAVAGGLRIQNPQKQGPNQTPPRQDFEHFPIVDFDAQESNDPEQRSAREAKGRKYSKRYLPKISESTDQLYSTADWDSGLPAIPTAKSSAVVIGTVTKSEAHLTADKTAIYSEFTVFVDTVIKNDVEWPVVTARAITVERNGGRVRMPSGKIIVSATRRQNMPQLGSRYVFFLTHDFEIKGDTGKDFYLLTGYGIQAGRVTPLDDTACGRTYKDVEESLFLKELLSTVGGTSNQAPE